MQFVNRHALHEIVIRVDHDAEAVNRNWNLDILDSGLGTEVYLRLLDGPRGVGDMGLTGAELLEAAAGARHANGYPDVAASGIAKLFSHGLGDGEHRAGAIYAYISRQLGHSLRGRGGRGRLSGLLLPLGYSAARGSLRHGRLGLGTRGWSSGRSRSRRGCRFFTAAASHGGQGQQACCQQDGQREKGYRNLNQVEAHLRFILR